MTIEFRPLPLEHELVVASAALVALEDWRLVVQAHRFTVSGHPSDDALSDAYVTSLGYQELGMPWPAVPLGELSHALAMLVWKEQAFNDEVVNEGVAQQFVARWLSGFPQPVRAYTNGSVFLDHAKPRPTGGTYNPIIGATFDTGAIVIGGNIIGMLWATDED